MVTHCAGSKGKDTDGANTWRGEVPRSGVRRWVGGSTGQRGADSRRLGRGGVGKPWNCQGRVSQEGGPGRILGDPNTTGQEEEGKEKE